MADPDTQNCPICAEPFQPNDVCASDIELGTCHAECLKGSPVVDLESGEETGGKIDTYPYSELMEPPPPQSNVGVQPLRWIVRGQSKDEPVVYAGAFGIARFYSIKGTEGDWTLSYPGADCMLHMEGLKTQHAARTAAQANYADNILSALTSIVEGKATAPAPQTHVAGIVPPHCSGYSFVFEPGVLHVKKDGSGYIVVNEEDFVLEDDRDGEGGSVHWIARLDASEIAALRDFLNGIPPRHGRVTEAMVNAADSVLSRRRPGIPDETIRLAIEAALATTEGSTDG